MKIPTKPPPYVVGPGCPKDLVADFTALCRCQLVAWTGHGGTMGEPWGNHGETMEFQIVAVSSFQNAG